MIGTDSSVTVGLVPGNAPNVFDVDENAETPGVVLSVSGGSAFVRIGEYTVFIPLSLITEAE